VKILETRRLALREMTLDDLDFYAAMIGDPETMRFYQRPFTREEAVQWIERQQARYATDGHGLWLVVDRQTGEPRGHCGLVMQAVDGVREPEIGYIINRDFWRQGLATEAAAAVRDWAFARGYDHVISIIREANEPSQGVARKIGMTFWKRAIAFDLEHLIFRAGRASVNA
jgi:RimJ/RimL family protein N-acetyltransferase